MYLLQLADRLASGLRQLPAERLEPHRSFLQSCQAEDGGFCGREPESDLYYTGFAVRGLAVSGGLPEESAAKLGNYLSAVDPRSLNTIDLISWLYSGLVLQATNGTDVLSGQDEHLVPDLIQSLESNRTSDGGYAKNSAGSAGSTYQSFLTALCYELLGTPQPLPNRLIRFLFDRQREDGGFVEIAPMKRSGTNPTAAAIALLSSLKAMDEDLASEVLGFLTDVVSTEGGFQANTRIPFADGLSTFTGLLTAQDLGRRDIIPPDRILKWLQSDLELPTGGFLGAAWDKQADTEYTFYGLGILGLLHSSA